MPRDSSLLLPHTQALLREARRPRLAKRKQEPTEDEKGEEEDEGDKDVQTGWQAKKWSQIPAHLEEPDREYLAKRRKGLPSMHTAMALQAAAAAVSAAPTRKTKIMKSDAEGNTTVYEVLVPEGQAVAGEVVEDTIMADAAPEKAAPGTIIEGVGIANAEGLIVATDLLQPPKRKNMPPKRIKKGGPGRGRKKVMFTGAEGHNSSVTSLGSGAAVVPSADGSNANGSAMHLDTVPNANSAGAGPQAGEGGGEGDGDEDDDADEGEEGDEGDEDDDREDGELSDTEAPSASTDLAPPTVPSFPSAFVSDSLKPLPTAESMAALSTTLIQNSDEADALVAAPGEESLAGIQNPQDEDQLRTDPYNSQAPPIELEPAGISVPLQADGSSRSPELPLAQISDERQEPLAESAPDLDLLTGPVSTHQEAPSKSPAQTSQAPEKNAQENDLLSNFEKELEQQEARGP